MSWIKIDHNLLSWRWYSSPTTLSVWIHLLLSANYKDSEVGTETIHRGEVLTTQERIAEATGLTRKQVRTALDHLKETGEIRANRTIGKTVVISIPNYDKYQGEGPTKGQQRANEGPHNKNDKNNRNILSSPIVPTTKPYSVPTIDEVREYERITSKGKDPDQFYRHYSGLDWSASGQRIYDWRRLYDKWEAPAAIERPKAEPRPAMIMDEDGYVYELVNGKYEVTRRSRAKCQ